MLRTPRLATLATLLWLAGACHAERVTRREPPLQRAKPQCPAPGTDECKARCGPAGGAAAGSSEGKCEAVLDDLCRSHCEAACGQATAALEQHIAEQERVLESQCGSGQPMEPGETLHRP